VIAESEIVLRNAEDDLPLCREAAEHAAQAAGFEGDQLGDVVSAVFEACVNAIVHGHGSEPATLRIRVYEDRLEAVIRDSGKGLDSPREDALPCPTIPHGRGIPLMKLFMDEVKLEYNGGLTVTLIKFRL
jgi:serine/threonine-protein kinase RsbW